jgi:hypothetical protein
MARVHLAPKVSRRLTVACFEHMHDSDCFSRQKRKTQNKLQPSQANADLDGFYATELRVEDLGDPDELRMQLQFRPQSYKSARKIWRALSPLKPCR